MDNRKLIDKALEARITHMLHIVNLKLERHLLQMELFIPVAILKIVLLELQFVQKDVQFQKL